MASVYNPSDSPVTIDDGVTIGGREHAETPLSKIIREHIAAGRLVRVEPASTTAKEEKK